MQLGRMVKWQILAAAEVTQQQCCWCAVAKLTVAVSVLPKLQQHRQHRWAAVSSGYAVLTSAPVGAAQLPTTRNGMWQHTGILGPLSACCCSHNGVRLQGMLRTAVQYAAALVSSLSYCQQHSGACQANFCYCRQSAMPHQSSMVYVNESSCGAIKGVPGAVVYVKPPSAAPCGRIALQVSTYALIHCCVRLSGV
jgi:hypothetical protein